MKRLLVLLFILFNADIYSEPTNEFDAKYVELIERGNKLYNEENNKGALRIFEEAKPIESMNYASYYGAGLCLAKMNHIDEARSELERALDLVKNEKNIIQLLLISTLL